MTAAKKMRLTVNPLAIIGQMAGLPTLTARAQAIGISRGYLAHIERGQAQPSEDVIAKMAVAYERDEKDCRYAWEKCRERYALRLMHFHQRTS